MGAGGREADGSRGRHRRTGWVVSRLLATALASGLIAIGLSLAKGRLRKTLWNVGFLLFELMHFRAPYYRRSELDVTTREPSGRLTAWQSPPVWPSAWHCPGDEARHAVPFYRPLLRQRLLPLQQVQNVPVAVGEEHQRVAALLLRLGQECDALAFQSLVNRVKIRHRDGQMPQPGGLHVRCGGRRALGFDDLNHRPVRCFHKRGLAVGRLVVDDEVQVLHVPASQLVRVGRRDGGMFNAFDHTRIVTVQPALSVRCDNAVSNAVGARHRLYRSGPGRSGVRAPFGRRSARSPPARNLGRRLAPGCGGDADIYALCLIRFLAAGGPRHLFRAPSAAADRRGTGRLGVGRSVPLLSQSHVPGGADGGPRPGSALRIASPGGMRLCGVPLLPFDGYVL